MMSREACTKCGKIVSTITYPSPYEGYFVSIEACEKIEDELYARRTPKGEIPQSLDVRTLLIKHCPSLVFCDDCQANQK
jgi:hypothetical protein